MADPQAKFHLMLRIEGPGTPPRLEDLLRDRYSVGRGGGAGEAPDFAVPEDAYLSRLHCRLHKTGDTYAVENVSPNGTRLNGKAIDKIVALKHKDRIEAGESTVLEFLAATDEERAQALQQVAGAKGARGAAGPKRPFYKSPVFVVVLALYAVIGLAILASGEDEKPKVADPGAGPYFGWMKKAPLLWDNDRDARVKSSAEMWDEASRAHVPADMRAALANQLYDEAKLRDLIPAGTQRKALAEEEWKKAVTMHGGPALSRGGHAYHLAIAGLRVLGLVGFPNLAEALKVKDERAAVIEAAIADLEPRVSMLHEQADQYLDSSHRKLARERYAAILEAVPSRYEAIHRFASERLDELQGAK